MSCDEIEIDGKKDREVEVGDSENDKVGFFV